MGGYFAAKRLVVYAISRTFLPSAANDLFKYFNRLVTAEVILFLSMCWTYEYTLMAIIVNNHTTFV
jgi:hypothetical protein